MVPERLREFYRVAVVPEISPAVCRSVAVAVDADSEGRGVEFFDQIESLPEEDRLCSHPFGLPTHSILMRSKF